MEQGGADKAIYEKAFSRIPALIDGSDPDVPEIEALRQPAGRKPARSLTL
jgi:hypothetical protein